jgi:hypothetical protein
LGRAQSQSLEKTMMSILYLERAQSQSLENTMVWTLYLGKIYF